MDVAPTWFSESQMAVKLVENSYKVAAVLDSKKSTAVLQSWKTQSKWNTSHTAEIMLPNAFTQFLYF